MNKLIDGCLVSQDEFKRELHPDAIIRLKFGSQTLEGCLLPPSAFPRGLPVGAIKLKSVCETMQDVVTMLDSSSMGPVIKHRSVPFRVLPRRPNEHFLVLRSSEIPSETSQCFCLAGNLLVFRIELSSCACLQFKMVGSEPGAQRTAMNFLYGKLQKAIGAVANVTVQVTDDGFHCFR